MYLWWIKKGDGYHLGGISSTQRAHGKEEDDGKTDEWMDEQAGVKL